jgi:hypothetical protein
MVPQFLLARLVIHWGEFNSSQFSVLGSRFSVLGSRFSVLGSRFSVLGSRFSENASPGFARVKLRLRILSMRSGRLGLCLTLPCDRAGISLASLEGIPDFGQSSVEFRSRPVSLAHGSGNDGTLFGRNGLALPQYCWEPRRRLFEAGWLACSARLAERLR